ncbi:MAG: type II toxin-antitoxin system PemK/MazF family toxin [bacterium]
MYKIFRVNFPYFENDGQSKLRPALFLTKPLGKFNLCLACFITSKNITKPLISDVLIGAKDAKKLNLPSNSWIRLHRTTSIMLETVDAEYGDLPKDLIDEVQSKLKLILNLK